MSESKTSNRTAIANVNCVMGAPQRNHTARIQIGSKMTIDSVLLTIDQPQLGQTGMLIELSMTPAEAMHIAERLTHMANLPSASGRF